MTQDEIIRMAREAGLATTDHGNPNGYAEFCTRLERFAALVAEATKVQPLLEPDGRCKYCLTYNGHQDGCLHEAQPQGEPVAYLTKATRFKVCATDQNCMITGLPAELNGRWVALVAAEDDCHLKYTTPPVVPQEPVAWMHVFMGVAQINTTPPEVYGKDWTHQPLYPPEAVEAAIESALLKQQELWIQATEEGIEAAIEATKEKAAQLVEDWDSDMADPRDIAAAIRSMK